MPNNKRGAMKKVCRQAVNDLERAQYNLAHLTVEYQELHPEIADVFKLAYESLEPVKALIIKQEEAI